jgi:hypothetical protein
MKLHLSTLCAAVVLATPLFAAVPFTDTFDSGVSGSVWSPWPSGPSSQNLLTTSNSKNHTPAGLQSAFSPQSDPAAWNATADFGATVIPAGQRLRASVWVWDDLDAAGSSTFPIANMLALVGDTGAGPGFGTEYFQLGALTVYQAGSSEYSVRTRYNDQNALGQIDTNVARKQGWTELAIEVNSVADGGLVRFFVDGASVGTSQRSAGNANLRWIRLGWNDKNYQNFWYDDVSVTLIPEPASAILLALGGLAVSLLSARRRR